MSETDSSSRLITATRFPAHTPQTATGRAAERLGELWARHGDEVSTMVRTMAGSSALLAGYLDLSHALKRSRLARRTTETISIAIQARLGCARCLAAHVTAGRAAGLSDDDIALAVGGSATDPATSALVSYAIAVHVDPASIDAHLLDELRALGHRDRDLLDVIGLVALNHLTGAFNLVAGLEPEEPMNTTTRLAAYAGVLAAGFAGAAGVGATVGPIDTGGQTHVVADDAHDQDKHDDEPGPAPTSALRAGTSLDADGVRIEPDRSVIAAGSATDYVFRVVDERGTAVTDYDVVHDRPLHLIVASRDLTVYHHLHPEQDGDTWSVALPALDPGTYRVFADSRPSGRDAVTLGVDLIVVDDVSTGNPPPVGTSSAVDGFDVTMAGTPEVGSAALSFTVRRDGASVPTEPYLGAAGHLVVLRSGDLAYVHAHADHQIQGDDTHGIAFDVAFPTAGTYRLFLDFAVDGTVHTADFTIRVPEAEAPSAAPIHQGH